MPCMSLELRGLNERDRLQGKTFCKHVFLIASHTKMIASDGTGAPFKPRTLRHVYISCLESLINAHAFGNVNAVYLTGTACWTLSSGIRIAVRFAEEQSKV